jgi:RHS repeat-associated protein
MGSSVVRRARAVLLALPALVGMGCGGDRSGEQPVAVAQKLAADTPGLRATFYGDMTLDRPVLSRTDGSIDFNWGAGSPAPGVAVDGFSVRWQGQVQPLYTETYTFITRADDGVRLWVNGQLVINNWVNQAETERSGTIALVAGAKYDIRLEYFDNLEDGIVQLSWRSARQARQVIPASQLFVGPEPAESAPSGPAGLNVSFFQGTALAGQPLLTRVDPNIDFDWGAGSPGTGVPVDSFSARWQGQVQARFSETYTFITRADDGVRLWVNGQQVINNFVNQSLTERTGTIALTAGTWYDIRVEYFDSAEGASLQLLWQSPSQPRQVIPSWRLSPGCNNARLNTLAVNGGFECTLDGWSEGYFRNPGWGTGTITLARVAGAGGSQGALRVVVPAAYPADGYPSPMVPYYAGAMVPLKEELPAGSWIRVAFDGRRVSGSPHVSVHRPFGGSLYGSGVTLTDDWQPHVLLLRLDAPTSSLIFNLHQLGLQYTPAAGEFLLDNLSVTKVPLCTDVPTGSKVRELLCFPPQTPAGQALRINFSGSSISGPRTLRAMGPWGADIGDNTMVTLATSNGNHQVTVRNQNTNAPLSLRLVPYYYGAEAVGALGTFNTSRPTFTVVTACDNNAGQQPGIANGAFECDRAFWTPLYWIEPEKSYRGDLITLARVAGAGGSQGALRVTFPTTYPAGVDPNGQLHQSGAFAELHQSLPAGFVNLRFDARRVSGASHMSIQRPSGGASGLADTPLTDSWQPYNLTFRISHATNGLVFALWNGTARTVAPGAFDIDNIRVAAAPAVPLEVTVTDGAGRPLAGRQVASYQGGRPFSVNAATDGSGRARLSLPAGSYRFGASDGAITFYSGASDHCAVTVEGGCRSATIVLPGDVPNVAVIPDSAAPGAAVDVSWSGRATPTADDHIGLYAVGAPGVSFLARQPTGGTAAGSARMTIPANAAVGNYEIRLTGPGGSLLATSNLLLVDGPPAPWVAIRYTANADPITVDGYLSQPGVQPWQLNNEGPPVARATVVNGVPAWELDSPGTNHEEFWTVIPTATDIAAARQSGWSLTARVRTVAGDAVDQGSTAEFQDGVRLWQMRFGATAAGEPIVGTHGDARTFTLAGGQNTFHSYTLRYDPSTSTVDLLVDGVERLSNLPGGPLGTPSFHNLPDVRIGFGDETSQDLGHSYYQSVEWAPHRADSICPGVAAGSPCPSDRLPIEFDTSALSSKMVLVRGDVASAFVDGTIPATLYLPPGFYYVQPGSGNTSFQFQLGANGQISYDPALATFLTGAGTNRLTMRGFTMSLDTSALSQRGYIIQSLFTFGSILQSGTPVTVLPTTYLFQIGSGLVASFSWTVGYDGTIQYPSEFDSFLSGRGTSTLVVRGHRVAVDARQMAPSCQGATESSNFFMYVFGLDSMPKSPVAEMTLVPSFYRYTDNHNSNGTPATSFIWSVATNGTVALDPALGPCVTGAGTSTMRVLCDPNAPPPFNQVRTCPQAVEVAVTVTSSSGAPLAGRDVTAFQGVHPFGAAARTDSSGRARVMVSPGSYRFGASDGAITFYSGATDHCAVTAEGGCRSASIVLPGEVANVLVTPEVVAPGAIVDVAWNGIPPAVGDTVGLYAVGAPGISFLASQPTGGVPAGSARLTVPSTTAPGSYEARLSRDTGTVVATSNVLRVTTTPCAQMPEGASCSDGNPCNGEESCRSSACQPGTPPSVDDGNACTADSCDPIAGVTHAPNTEMEGRACGGACNVCSAGACAPAATDVCDSRPPAEVSPAAEPPVGAEFAGVLKGAFSVSPTGAATYTVPISLPPGVAGMAPNLSLVYNSQGGNGIAGQGWELAGLSMIHRCPRTRVQDGQARPVEITDDDGLCLDGQRLLEDGSGGYYVEAEQFSAIRPNRGTVGGPIDSFEIVTKSGETRTYGGLASARVTYVGPPADIYNGQTLVWLLSNVSDAWGNYFDVHYNRGRGHETGEDAFLTDGVKVTSIEYTGFRGSPEEDPRPQAPFWRVVLDYEQRQDVRNARIGWISIPKKHRLSVIRVVAPGAPDHARATYTLSYLDPDPTHMLPSRLRSIGYCSDGSCLTPLEFDWEGGGYAWRSDQKYALGGRIDRPATGTSYGTQLVDLDGDGRVDFVDARFLGEIRVERNGLEGFETAPPSWTLPVAIVTPEGLPNAAMFADMNNDGLLDLVASATAANQPPRVWFNRLREGSGWVPGTIAGLTGPRSRWGTVDFTKPHQYALLDMNGDGRADVVRFVDPASSDVIVFWNTAAGWQDTEDVAPRISYDYKREDGNDFGLAANCSFRDVNRDGLPDVVCGQDAGINVGPAGMGPGTTKSAWKLSIFEGPTAFGNSGVTEASRSQGDVDGDGYHDIVDVYPYKQPGCPDYVEADRFGTSKPRAIGLSTGNGYINAPAAYLDALNTFMLPPVIHTNGFPFINPGPCRDIFHRRNHLMALTDLNADGLADVVINHDDPDLTVNSLGGQLLVNTGATWVDYDGESNRYERAPATPVPAVPAEGDPAGYPNDRTRAAAFVDLNGDGVLDLVQTQIVNQELFSEAWINDFEPPRIRAFPNGMALKTDVSYASITEPAGWAAYRDTAALVPGTTYLAVPLRVVTSVLAENGRGQRQRSRSLYTYRSLRGSATGRGPQGFAEVEVYEEASRTTVTTTFAQAYPYTGRPLTVVKKKNDVAVSHTSTSYCDSLTEVMGRLECTPETGPPDGAAYERPGRSLFVYAHSTGDVGYVWGQPAGSSAAELIATTTDYRYDQFGNPIRTTVTMQSSRTGETHVKSTENTYGDPGSPEQRRGRVTRSVTTARRTFPVDDNNAPVTHTAEFEYAGFRLNGIEPPLPLVKKKLEPGEGAPIELHTAYEYDFRGNVITTTECQDQFAACVAGARDPVGAVNPSFRTTRISYEPAGFDAPEGPDLTNELAYDQVGRFPVRTTNPLGQTEFMAFEPMHGQLIQKTALDGVHACYRYDSFGRKTREIQRCGSGRALVTTTSQHLTAQGDPDAAVVTVSRPPSGIVTWTYSDVLGRPIRTRVRGFSGDIIETGSKTYDLEGRLARETKARIEGQEAFATVPVYDPVGRVESTTQDLGVIDDRGGSVQDIVRYTYDRSTVTTARMVAGQTQGRTETKNVVGQVVSVRDANGAESTYKYDADGNLKETCLYPVAEICPSRYLLYFEYDLRGRKIRSVDPDMGDWRYQYNGFGDLIGQTDAKGQTTFMTYDVLGRKTSKSDAAGTSTWIYDVAPGAGAGKLAAVASGPDARLAGECAVPFVTGSSARHAVRSYAYNEVGQIQEVAECVDGTTFTTGYEFDSAGRQSLVRYPEVRGTRLALRNHYTSTGYLHYITDVADGLIYWAARQVNALGQVTEEYTRNGVSTVSSRNGATGWLMGSTSTSHLDAATVIQQWANTFDEAGNLRSRSRTDQIVAANSLETFEYDPLNRLRNSRVRVPTQSYDATETYDYDRFGNLTSKAGAEYTYTGCFAGDRPAGPHAVCTVAGSPFTYDLNGNMIAGSGRTVDYDAHNKPSRFSQGSSVVEFIYGADGDRVVQSVTGSSSARTLYVGLGATGKSLYERTTRGGTVEHVQFLYAGGTHSGNAFAVRVTTEGAPTAAPPAMKYYAFDHLGSVTTTSDDGGRVVGATSGSWANSDAVGYDPWGARRNPDGRSADATAFQRIAGRREFTSHEAIPDIGLVNMNGRVYDSVLGRFLSPDPTVQFVADLQSYNRYSYVLNNPVSYTDPTGYTVLGTLRDIGLGLAVGAATAACVASGGVGCGAIGLAYAFYNASAAMARGASGESVVASYALGALAGGVGGVIGGYTAYKLGGSLAAQMIGGAVAGVATTAVTSALTGQQLGWNLLVGAAAGAAAAGIEAAIRGSFVSKASVPAPEPTSRPGENPEAVVVHFETAEDLLGVSSSLDPDSASGDALRRGREALGVSQDQLQERFGSAPNRRGNPRQINVLFAKFEDRKTIAEFFKRHENFDIDSSEEFMRSDVGGLTWRNSTVVYLEGNQTSISNWVLHEIGHVFINTNEHSTDPTSVMFRRILPSDPPRTFLPPDVDKIKSKGWF